MFVSQLRQLSLRFGDSAAVRSELQRIRLAAQPDALPEVEDSELVAESDRKAEAALAEIGTRMRQLGAPLWEDQATALKRALASGENGQAADPVLIPDKLIGDAAPVLTPRQIQILALVQAESRWAASMRTEGGPRVGPAPSPH